MSHTVSNGLVQPPTTSRFIILIRMRFGACDFDGTALV